jgi:arylsulfatase A-like enzyme/tetratricopeptide (TPR) repeat protein
VGRLLRLAAVAVVVLAAAALGWRWLQPPPPAAPRHNLLLVSIDALRADRLGYAGHAAARTPRLDGLAARGLAFSQARTVVPLTLPAHASLLTGTLPGRHGVRDDGQVLGEEHATLAEVLRGAGYRTGAFVGSFLLDSRFGLARGFDGYFDALDPARHGALERRGDEVVGQALAWLDEAPQRPFFAWVHLHDPHAPYDAPEPHAAPPAAGPAAAYDAEVAWTDSLVGRLLDHLALRGLAERTWVVVVADHGEALGEHGEEGHGFFVYEATLRIPLIVAGPSPVQAAVDDPVSLVDVMPTVALALTGAVPPGVQGRSLLTREAPGPSLRERVVLSETWLPRLRFGWSELVAVRDGRYKLIQAPRPELYDLLEDPGETRDLALSDPTRAAGLEKALMAAVAAAGPAAPRPHARDPETRQRLEALGHLGGLPGPRHLDARPRPDPKDRIALFTSMREAVRARGEARLDDALALASRAVADDPGLVEAHTLMGDLHQRAGRIEPAVDSYREAASLDPDDARAVLGLAAGYAALGRLDEAERGFERARELDPHTPEPSWHLADLWMRKGRFAEAESALKEAMERSGDRPTLLLKMGECYLEMKRYAEAEAVLKEALAARPELPRAHFVLGRVHEARGQAAGAIAEYEAELRRDPRDHLASLNLGRVLQQQGRLPEAVARFQASVAAVPDFAIGHVHLARALLDLGDLPGARAAARRALASRTDPRAAPQGHYVLAEVYAREGRPRDAAREIAAARRLERGR